MKIERSSVEEAMQTTFDRRVFDQTERDSMDDSDFGDPENQAFPIKSAQDVINASQRLHNSKGDKSKIKARIKAIAKRKGFALPDTWTDGSDDDKPKEDRAMDAPASKITGNAANDKPDDTEDDDAPVKAAKGHGKFDGTHTHEHDHANMTDEEERMHRASGSHSHSHAHDNNSSHNHSHSKMRATTPPPDTDEEEDVVDDTDSPTDKPEVSDDGDHDKFSGSHSHIHDSFQRADGSNHSHNHSHNNDNNHDHHDDKADDNKKERAVIHTSSRPSLYMPFMRIDAAKREVVGQATAEIPDSYGTIFGYYPKAWELWRGNVREQHDPKKAVGKKVEYFAHDDTKSVDLHSRVSRGANDTWMKVEDDVLTGYSLSIIPDKEFGNDSKKWPKKEYQGKEYPYLPRYTIAEVSLVDNPSCPGCNIEIVRANGFVTEEIDVSDDMSRADTRISGGTKTAMHDSIGHTLKAAASQMKNCDCNDCQSALRVLDPDNDGDIDFEGGFGQDTDKDAQDMERVVTSLIERSLSPVYSRLQKIAGNLSKINLSTTQTENIDTIVVSAVNRALEIMDVKLDAKMATLSTQTSLDELRAEMSAVKGQVVKIADQPIPGGPVLNAGAVEKKLPTDTQYRTQEPSYGAVYDAITNLARNGKLDTPDKQVEAMTAGLRAQRQGR